MISYLVDLPPASIPLVEKMGGNLAGVFLTISGDFVESDDMNFIVVEVVRSMGQSGY